MLGGWPGVDPSKPFWFFFLLFGRFGVVRAHIFGDLFYTSALKPLTIATFPPLRRTWLTQVLPMSKLSSRITSTVRTSTPSSSR